MDDIVVIEIADEPTAIEMLLAGEIDIFAQTMSDLSFSRGLKRLHTLIVCRLAAALRLRSTRLVLSSPALASSIRSLCRRSRP